ncbi:MAG TPA: 30S ribosomal protein S12 methylthiotransferase RimO [Acidobacteriota bacterium]|nr:30S ribosomal protein S12 methylthiotransferase RimO [Acidobacteriota bacterium]
MAKVGFVSLGCPKNLVDSEVMLGLLARVGHQITHQAEEAEILVVNTCGFIESAQQESIDTILEMARYKEQGRCRQLVVAGCLVERFRKQLQEQIPEVDAVVGTNEIPRILQVCGPARGRAAPVPHYEERELFLYDDADPRLLTTPRHSAYIKIAEGCDHPCTFCVIPQMRGRFRSRPMDSVVREAERLAQGGVREINLVGQDTTMYGWDRGDRRGLARLLRRLGQVEGISWVRFLYAYPNNIYDELLDAMRETEAACRYIDVPLQHASKNMLSRMKRGGHRGSLLRLLERIRKRVPGAAVRTTVIVGFPGETEEDFEELLDFVRQARFERLGAFTYSDESSAASHALDAKVQGEVAAQRQQRVMEVQAEISSQINRKLVGQTLPVMAEGPSKESDLLWEGRLETQAPDIDGVVYLTDGIDESVRPGDILPVRIIEAHPHDLVGHAQASAGLKGESTTFAYRPGRVEHRPQ